MVDLLDEVGDVVAFGHHLVGGVVVGPAGITEKSGDFVARLHQVGENFQIFRIGAGVEGEGETAAQGIAFGKGENGQSIGVIGGDVNLAIGIGLVAIDVILGQAVEFGGIGFDHFLSVG